jgi:hypothetical protein
MKNIAVTQFQPVVCLLPKTTINSICMIGNAKQSRNKNKCRLKRKRNDKKIYIATIQ